MRRFLPVNILGTNLDGVEKDFDIMRYVGSSRSVNECSLYLLQNIASVCHITLARRHITLAVGARASPDKDGLSALHISSFQM